MFLRLSGCNLACIWCFVGNTKVATPSGSKRIKDIKVGDLVLSSDGKIITPKKVTKIFQRATTKAEIVKVQVEGDSENTRVFCTSNHEFFTNKGWIQAKDLQAGDEINYIDTIDWYMKNDNPSARPEGRQRLSALAKKTFTGKKATHETRLRLRASKLGPKNPRYTGIRADQFRDYLVMWDRTRRDALKRDGYRCQNCGSTERLEVHHTIPFRISRSNDLSILITLCKSCHLQAERQFLHNGKKVVSMTPVTLKQAARFNGSSASIDVYNLEVEDNHTYFANSLLVHNCDTPYTWNWKGTNFQHPDKYDPKQEVHKMSIHTVLDVLDLHRGTCKSLVISGGEPLLQQEQLCELLVELKKQKWWIEVETNGTIEPTDEFIRLIDQFNCSPKTSNAGSDNPIGKRFNQEALIRINRSGKATFKFVFQSPQDLDEARSIMYSAKVDSKDVWLMPEGRTREEQLLRQTEVETIAKVHGYNFSPRLHILEFGNKRAV
jgi:organic radical activating enzyme